jgi:hypothetical protein
VGRAVAVRDRRYTYVERLYEGPELYDRVADSAERVNIAGRPEHAQVQRALREALLRWLLETCRRDTARQGPTARRRRPPQTRRTALTHVRLDRQESAAWARTSVGMAPYASRNTREK